MNRIAGLLLLAMVTGVGLGQTSSPSTDQKLSPAERSMAQAKKSIEKNPNDFEAYNSLALAFSRRARETSNVVFYTQGEEALQKSFAISPDNFDGQRIRVWLLLGKHEFAAALEAAKELSRKLPDDVMLYGFLTDANVELGNYKEAETAAQWMLDLKPGNMPGLTRGAYLRELFGDIDGSLDLMNMAYQSTPPSEVEYDEAAELLKQRYQVAPHAENLFDLARALQWAGHKEQTQQAFAEFEQKSLLETNRADNSNHELIFYYADYANQPAKALEVAQREYARRHDVFTMDCYAWALHLNNRNQEALNQITAALAVGIRDAQLFRHAGEIALAAGDQASAERYLRQSAELNTSGSEEARIALARLLQ